MQTDMENIIVTRKCIIASCDTNRLWCNKKKIYLRNGKTLFRLPLDADIRSRWICKIMPYVTPERSHTLHDDKEENYICEDHFHLHMDLINYEKYLTTRGHLNKYYFRKSCLPSRNMIENKVEYIYLLDSCNVLFEHDYSLLVHAKMQVKQTRRNYKDKMAYSCNLKASKGRLNHETIKSNEPFQYKYNLESGECFYAGNALKEFSNKPSSDGSETISVESFEIMRCDDNDNDLIKHIQAKHLEIGSEEFHCIHCPSVFSDANAIIDHLRITHGEVEQNPTNIPHAELSTSITNISNAVFDNSVMLPEDDQDESEEFYNWQYEGDDGTISFSNEPLPKSHESVSIPSVERQDVDSSQKTIELENIILKTKEQQENGFMSCSVDSSQKTIGNSPLGSENAIIKTKEQEENRFMSCSIPPCQNETETSPPKIRSPIPRNDLKENAIIEKDAPNLKKNMFPDKCNNPFYNTRELHRKRKGTLNTKKDKIPEKARFVDCDWRRVEKPKSSPTWQYFELKKNKKGIATCKICHNDYSSRSLGNLKKHLQNTHRLSFVQCEDEDAGERTKNGKNKRLLKSRKREGTKLTEVIKLRPDHNPSELTVPEICSVKLMSVDTGKAATEISIVNPMSVQEESCSRAEVKEEMKPKEISQKNNLAEVEELIPDIGNSGSIFNSIFKELAVEDPPEPESTRKGDKCVPDIIKSTSEFRSVTKKFTSQGNPRSHLKKQYPENAKTKKIQFPSDKHPFTKVLRVQIGVLKPEEILGLSRGTDEGHDSQQANSEESCSSMKDDVETNTTFDLQTFEKHEQRYKHVLDGTCNKEETNSSSQSDKIINNKYANTMPTDNKTVRISEETENNYDKTVGTNAPKESFNLQEFEKHEHNHENILNHKDEEDVFKDNALLRPLKIIEMVIDEKIACLKCPNLIPVGLHLCIPCQERILREAVQCETGNSNQISQEDSDDEGYGDSEPRTCCVCKKRFRNKDSLNRHMKNFHAEKSEFGVCHTTMNSAEYLKSHLRRVHRRENMCDCEHCGKTYRNRKQLNIHNREVHEETSRCPKRFNSADYLERYVKECVQDELDSELKVEPENGDEDWCIRKCV